MEFIKKSWKGFLLCLCIAIPAWFLGQLLPVIGGPVFAILAGMVITLFWKNKDNVCLLYTSNTQHKRYIVKHCHIRNQPEILEYHPQRTAKIWHLFFC